AVDPRGQPRPLDHQRLERRQLRLEADRVGIGQVVRHLGLRPHHLRGAGHGYVKRSVHVDSRVWSAENEEQARCGDPLFRFPIPYSPFPQLRMLMMVWVSWLSVEIT